MTGRRGIDGLAQVCRALLKEDPMSAAVIVFRSRQRKAIKLNDRPAPLNDGGKFAPHAFGRIFKPGPTAQVTR